ncbi:30S ribosomal protein S14 [Candidatus Peregrinibacteria bacterium CG08_land_8_20_14_0_20_41_10]|nr:MAG: 30S ribosomal protein S14 [Candidatus Peregrinibacteria bacterium CG08_land_8_20_14_0_20_41_10]
MAKESLVVKQRRMVKRLEHYRSLGKKMPLATRVYNRCHICGRIGGYMRKFEMCRICFRERAERNELVGVRKSSW